jgi:hypothetical protein
MGGWCNWITECRIGKGRWYHKEALRTRYYKAFEVLFPDGKSELFWKHQLE